MSRPLNEDRLLRLKIALVVGFISVSVSVFFAHINPATGYELSVYTMTPRSVWVGLLVALSIALVVSFHPAVQTSVRSSALLLGGLVSFVFVSLPLIRGYRFYGHHDALTHLGWARALGEGTIAPIDLLYPGIHIGTLFISSQIGFSVPRSMLLIVVLMASLFFIFVPLAVREVTPTQFPVVVAAFSSFLLLPITTIATHMTAHAMTQAVLFSALFVYLVTKYLLTDHQQGSFSATGTTLALLSFALVLYHPQLVAHLLVVALGICLVQFVAHRHADSRPIATRQSFYGQTLIVATAFLVWSYNHGFFVGTATDIVSSVLDFLFGSGRAGESVATQGASLNAIGATVTEIFFKLFGVHLLFTLIVVGLVLSLLLRRNKWSEDVSITTIYFTTGLTGLAGLFVFYYIASGSEIYFRVFGLMMVFVTILGSIAIADWISSLARITSARIVYPAGAIVFGFLMVVSLLAVFPSPYIYNASEHVTETQLSGYETAFATQDDDVTLTGFRSGPNRFDDAVNGNADRMRLHESVSEDAYAQGLQEYYAEDRYLAVTSADHQREINAYQGLRYSERDFESLKNVQGISRVQSNGEFELYYVHATGA